MEQIDTYPWPDNIKAAISLSFDDGRPSQLNVAIPILDEYGLKGTFYIKPGGDDWKTVYTPWREVAQNQHEIGNHTLSHICSRNFGWSGRALETISLDYIESDILEAEGRLRELIPEQTERTFCYPCYQNYVGEGLKRQSYVPIVAKHFPAARGMGEAANHPLYTDLHYLTSWTAAGWMSGDALIGFAEDAIKKDRWCIITFHDVSEVKPDTWLPGASYHGAPVAAESFRKLCKFLVENKDKIWTGTVLESAEKTIEWRKSFADQR
ncbi:polysaccharide deacetylase family protein [Candidatus Poribacteria bacterium]|nr:polysaccharide deacetylase family protein [Candidatus Poribacteria bacterium]